jgi:predicted nucleic acid-binding protein
VNGYMLDTNIFNRIADGLLSVDVFTTKKLFATHVQFDEVENNKNAERRTQLIKAFAEVAAQKMPTSSAAFDVSRWDECGWSDGDLFEKMLVSLKDCDEKNNCKKDIKNQLRDILIAETAIKNSLLLITDDKCLQRVARHFGCSVRSVAEVVGSQ